VTSPFNALSGILPGAGYTIRLDSSDPGTLLVIDHETGEASSVVIDSDSDSTARAIEAVRREQTGDKR
jgi:hypothetical protein